VPPAGAGRTGARRRGLQAFEEAETIMSGLAVRIGIDAPMANTIGALHILEELRAAAIGDEARCRAPD
jgi:hypothetical protein